MNTKMPLKNPTAQVPLCRTKNRYLQGTQSYTAFSKFGKNIQLI